MEHKLIEYWKLKRRKDRRESGLLVLALTATAYFFILYLQAKGII